MGTLYSLISFIVAIAILVVVHEFGHFWVAKRLGVKVLRFSVGFGKPLWVRKFGKDNTELVVAAIPLGGYVKMLDENEDEVADDEKHRAFNRKPLWVRTAVVIAGPLFNFLFAIVAYAAVFSFGVVDLQPVVDKIASDSIASTLDVREGDRILKIDGYKVTGWGEHRIYLMRRALSGETVAMTLVGQNGAEREVKFDLSEVDIQRLRGNVMGDVMGLYPYQRQIPPVVGEVLDGPAMRAGMKSGDRVVEIAGKKINTWSELVKTVASNAGKEISIVVINNNVKRKLLITPDEVKTDKRNYGRINIRVDVPEFPKDKLVDIEYTVLQSIVVATSRTWNMSALTLQMLNKMLQLKISTKNISGPITIAEYAGKSAKIGLDSFVLFLAVVSISLGVLNLLPVPVLDGGHLLYYLIEAIKGSPVSEQAMMVGQQVGIFLLVGLMMLAFYNDLVRLFG
ncbi:MAG: RIP metalloprotease RseP [Proteobacteria bacterium]|nr:RIP metalloprotease RseP [Pseudomonadota bacterium]